MSRARATGAGDDLPRPPPGMGPVITAEVLIRHGVDDDAILRYLTRQWGLNDPEPRLALHAAHILWAREHSSGIQSSSAGTG